METLRERIPLRRRKILKKSLLKIVVTTVVAAIITLGLVLLLDYLMANTGAARELLEDKVDGIMIAWFILIGLLICTSPFYQYLYFRKYFYDVDEQNVIIRKGVIATREITLSFKKITDVYVDQDIFDWIFGLYDVHISTPTVESGKFAHIDGVDKAGAQEIKMLILEHLNK